jgi:hypothetical protein
MPFTISFAFVTIISASFYIIMGVVLRVLERRGIWIEFFLLAGRLIIKYCIGVKDTYRDCPHGPGGSACMQ